jgi:glycosyltransferase involved in cell wall biosynthesis
MAASLPVIATNVGGIPELINNEENGLLVPPADPVALAQAIRRLGDDPDEAFQMGRQGRLRAEKQFTLQRMILQIEQLCGCFVNGGAQLSGARHD